MGQKRGGRDSLPKMYLKILQINKCSIDGKAYYHKPRI